MNAHSDIYEIISDASYTFTGKDALDVVKESYRKALKRYPVKAIQDAITILTQTHSYRTLPLAAEIINVITLKLNISKNKFITDTPQFMVFQGKPKSRTEMENHLNSIDKHQAYEAIKQWNKLTKAEQEKEFEYIGLGWRQRAANRERVSKLNKPLYDFNEDRDNPRYKKVPCCICSEQVTPITSINDILEFLKITHNYKEKQYACTKHTKEIIKNAGCDI